MAPEELERLRRPPAAHTVPGSLPVLSFGGLASARVATVGLNPSWAEYVTVSKAGLLTELNGSRRRLETLASLDAESRETLTDAQCQRVIAATARYFASGGAAYWRWFGHLERVLGGFGASYLDGSAVHLDVVQEATLPAWSLLTNDAPDEAAALKVSDLPFLVWQIGTAAIHTVLANGRSVLNVLVEACQAEQVAAGSMARVQWWVGSGIVHGRPIRVAGWNLPLARPTGLGAIGEHALGVALCDAVRGHSMGVA